MVARTCTTSRSGAGFSLRERNPRGKLEVANVFLVRNYGEVSLKSSATHAQKGAGLYGKAVNFKGSYATLLIVERNTSVGNVPMCSASQTAFSTFSDQLLESAKLRKIHFKWQGTCRGLYFLWDVVPRIRKGWRHYSGSCTRKVGALLSAGQLVFHIFGALTEFERNLIRERTIAGLEAARAREELGVLLGLVVSEPQPAASKPA